MAEPTGTSVLGDFNDREFSLHGVTSRFFRRDGHYMVRTEGPDGRPQEYPVRYTFGWWPLQQYLIEFPGGRLQTLGIAWDSRTSEQGGQRWFHLYPKERIAPTSPLHWTGIDQNWNYQCAECHSTNLRKGYDLATDSFHTTWSDINVACESCHGPASRHVTQAKSAAPGRSPVWDASKGLVVDLADRDGGVWAQDPATGKPKRSVPRAARTPVEICARCHSRRGTISEDGQPGRPLGDTHRVSLLDAGLYSADGQIAGEVYEYGSFVQSRMFHQGVICTDCHEAHSLTLKAPGNAVCTQCHSRADYDAEGHHRHRPGGAGASCVSCHMPQRLYMTVDERADHSLRIPRPDLTLKLGTPNACNQCHTDKTPDWAAKAVRQWYGDATSKRSHYGEALDAGRKGAPDAAARLLALAADETQPAITRATALDLLRASPDPANLLTVGRLVHDGDDLIRAAALRDLETADGDARMRLAFPLLDDPVRLVRTTAARVLAPLATQPLSADKLGRLRAGLDEYRATQLANAERPESHMNLGLLAADLQDAQAAEQSYRTALRLDPRFGPAYVNLADLYRALGRDSEGEAVLRQGLAALPGDASLYQALGLLQIRGRRLTDAVGSLARAAELAPENPGYAYAHALALDANGETNQALAVLRKVSDRHPNNRDILAALAAIAQKIGDQEAERDYRARLEALH